MLFIGITFLIFGIMLIYWINRRKFNRRGIAGVEEFRSYENAVLIKLIERIGKWIAYIFLFLSILYFWRYSKYRGTDKNILEQSAPTSASLLDTKY